MTSHYRWYPASEDVIIPWNASYEFPSQANKAVKITPRLVPKSGSSFVPGQVIRLEFPAQGYIHPGHTTLEFDVALTGYTDVGSGVHWSVWLQNNIGSIFSRARLLYGSTPIEDLYEQHFITRQLTELTTGPENVLDQKSIASGIGGVTNALGFNASTRRMLHSTSSLTGAQFVNPETATRRYQIQLPFGMFNQGKLLPVKFMASQFTIELTLAPTVECLMANPSQKAANSNDESNVAFTFGTLPLGTPTYTVSNVNLIPEILEFDAAYDADFAMGLKSAGVPIQFSSWNYFQTAITGQNMQMIIQERSRSVKSIFAFATHASKSLQNDSGASYGDLAGSRIISYQYRIGGRYFPAAPVEVGDAVFRNGSCEAYVECAKALGVLGDNRLSSSANFRKWNRLNAISATPFAANGNGNLPTIFGADDFQYETNVSSYNDLNTCFSNTTTSSSASKFVQMHTGVPNLGVKHTATTVGSSVFCMAINLETTNGREISGLNAEEQSDITLMVKYSTGPAPGVYEYKVFTYCDQIMILRENNQVEIVL